MFQGYLVLFFLVFVESLKADEINHCYRTGCQPVTWAVKGCEQFGSRERSRTACVALAGLRHTVAGFQYECCTGSGGGGTRWKWNDPYYSTVDVNADGAINTDSNYNLPVSYDGSSSTVQGGYPTFVNYGRYKRNND